MTSLRRVVTVALCLVAALPPGWCCYVGAAGCCGRVSTGAAETVPAPCDGCCGSCCCPAEGPASRPNEPPRRLPLRTCRCCLEQVMKQPDRVPRLAAPQAAVVLPAIAPPGPDLADSLPPADRPVTFSPPLHLLHCVWLC